jgi:hypothetical protein
MIRDWTDSQRFDGIPAEAERLFTRLILKADDYGRFHADPRLVASLCFPYGGETAKTIARCLEELRNRGLVALYEVADRPFLAIPRYGQRLKQSRAKFPQPAGKDGNWVPDSTDFREVPGSSGKFLLDLEVDLEGETEEIPPIPPKGGERVDGALGDFEAFWKAYPRKMAKKAAFKAWRNAKDKPPLTDVLAAIELQMKSPDWMKDGGRFIPYPASWLNQGCWEDKPLEVAGGNRRTATADSWRLAPSDPIKPDDDDDTPRRAAQ